MSTRLHNLVRAGDKAAVVRLLKKDRSLVNAVDNDYSQTPLHVAAESGHAEIVAVLIDKRADVNALDKNAWTPLHSAASGGHLGICELLLAKGAFARAMTNEGASPLHYFVRMPVEDPILYHKVLSLMISKGADVNSQNKFGDTPLHQACVRGREQCVLFLLNNKAQINLQNSFGETGLHFAARSGHVGVVTILLNMGADPFVKSENGTPLEVAEAMGHEDTARRLKLKMGLVADDEDGGGGDGAGGAGQGDVHGDGSDGHGHGGAGGGHDDSGERGGDGGGGGAGGGGGGGGDGSSGAGAGGGSERRMTVEKEGEVGSGVSASGGLTFGSSRGRQAATEVAAHDMAAAAAAAGASHLSIAVTSPRIGSDSAGGGDGGRKGHKRQQSSAKTFHCRSCGGLHGDNEPWVFFSRCPASWSDVLLETGKGKLSTDLCKIGDDQCFIRALLHIPVLAKGGSSSSTDDSKHTLIFGVWVKTSRDEFDRYVGAWSAEGREGSEPIEGSLDSWMRGYEDTRGIKVQVQPGPVGQRPRVVKIVSGGRDLATDMNEGITYEKAKARVNRMVKG